MANFDVSIAVILKNEGGYVNNPADPGGETNFGICKESYPDVDIKSLTVDGAKVIYKRDFWDKVHGDDIVDQNFATSLLDFAVNAGVGTAGKQVQKVLGVAVDGVIGQQTIHAINNTPNFSKGFAKGRADYYVALVTNKYTDIVFLKGWINRTIDLI